MLFQPFVEELVRHLNCKRIVLQPDGSYRFKPCFVTLAIDISANHLQTTVPYRSMISHHSPVQFLEASKCLNNEITLSQEPSQRGISNLLQVGLRPKDRCYNFLVKSRRSSTGFYRGYKDGAKGLKRQRNCSTFFKFFFL